MLHFLRKSIRGIWLQASLIAMLTAAISFAQTALSPIVLPIEVVGPAGVMREVAFDLPAESKTGAYKLAVQIHRLDYPDKVGIQVNDLDWILVNEDRVVLESLAKAYGGIGGGFHTIKFSLRLPVDAVRAGRNTIRFRFEHSNGDSSGYRVLAFNFLDEANRPLLPKESFMEEDPSSWRAPLGSAEDREAGQRLWYSSDLVKGALSSDRIQAKCSDCHARDGRDLKYFNFSNDSIRERSVFHGLTAHQGDQIASYIRSLAVENPGRPWNPPYQPGPGLDQKPVSHWAAGAGLASVLDRDAKTLNYISDEAATFEANLSAREVPIAIQLPDWNDWLPKIHPKDAWGDDFTSSEFNKYYEQIRSTLRRRDAESFVQSTATLSYWEVRRREFVSKLSFASEVQRRQRVYAASLWKMVKLWEVMNEFELESFGRALYGPQADERAWWDHDAFLTSPNMLQLSAGPGTGNGLASTHLYLSYTWYHLQLILNNSNKRQGDNAPIDWPYTYAIVKDLSAVAPNAGLLTLWMTKGAQISDNGKGPNVLEMNGGWQWRINDLSRLVHSDLNSVWSDISAEERAKVINRWVEQWLRKLRTFTPEQFYSAQIARASETLAAKPDGDFGDRIWYSLPRLRYYGLTSERYEQLLSWAATVWTVADWTRIRGASCVTSEGGNLNCTSDQYP